METAQVTVNKEFVVVSGFLVEGPSTHRHCWRELIVTITSYSAPFQLQLFNHNQRFYRCSLVPLRCFYNSESSTHWRIFKLFCISCFTLYFIIHS